LKKINEKYDNEVSKLKDYDKIRKLTQQIETEIKKLWEE